MRKPLYNREAVKRDFMDNLFFNLSSHKALKTLKAGDVASTKRGYHIRQTRDIRGTTKWKTEKPIKFPVKKIEAQLQAPTTTEVLAPVVKPFTPALLATPTPYRDARELRFCRRHAASVNGLTEFSTPDGRIDILTEDAVIEVKMAANWKHAIGQVLVYSSHFPTRVPTIVLLDDIGGEYKRMAQPHCDRLGITLLSMGVA